MAVGAGEKITLAQLDALYLRLYNLRNTHASSAHQINASRIPAAQSSSGLRVGDPIAVTTAKIDLLKQELADLANSQWYQSNTAGTVVSMTNFSGNFSVPNIGDLIKASDFNLIENTIATAETIIPNYSNKYNSQYSSDYSSDYSNRYRSRYGSRYGSQYNTCYSTCYSTCYGSQYGSQYGSRYGSQYSSQYRTCYGSRYGSRYGTRYGTRYGSRYGSRYGTCYRTCYGNCYGSRYGSRYRTCYSAKYAGQNSIKC